LLQVKTDFQFPSFATPTLNHHFNDAKQKVKYICLNATTIQIQAPERFSITSFSCFP